MLHYVALGKVLTWLYAYFTMAIQAQVNSSSTTDFRTGLIDIICAYIDALGTEWWFLNYTESGIPHSNYLGSHQ